MHPSLTLRVVGYGGFFQSSVSREGSKGPDPIFYWIQEAAVLHVHALRTRVSVSLFDTSHV